ncbi:C40 family peptidase [Kitasatospora sp. NBC_01266]|uniref:C40 family peptidase n=1 Tax=Kitasatospora sp. NBC_01266 TaxID=2903572 RepID=UPI002E35B0CA|nr:C40 family peptidase [Kitasatospora sp. NBC_01266]
MKPDLNPDLTSADPIADQPSPAPEASGTAEGCDESAADTPTAEHGSHHRATRLRHRVGLAAAIVAGAGSIGFGADLASAAPLPEHLALAPGLVSADDPTNGDDGATGDDDQGASADGSDSSDDSGSTSSTSSTADTTAGGGDIQQGWDGSVYWFQNSSGEWRYTSHRDTYLSRIGSNGDGDSGSSSGTDSSASTTNGDIQQGWDGSVYWFQNSSGEWRYTSHRDIYLNRIGSNGDGDSGSGSGSGTDSGQSAGAAQSEASSGDVDSALAFAQDQLGKPFVWGGNGPDGYDCSGLTQQSFRRAGISLPRIADEQYSATTPVSASRMQRGDLLFWSYDGSVGGIHHVAIYLGGNRYIEAAHPGTTVRIAHLNSGYFPSFISRP